MTRKMLACAMSLSLIAGNAWAATKCVGPDDMMAMKTASLQQQLMVAAFSCNDVALYNRFVLSHQRELQDSDAALLAFFVRENAEGGTEDYHAFKTRAANVSALESARDQTGYCARALQLFNVALDPGGANLSWFVSSQWRATGEFINATCTADTDPTAAVQTQASAPSGFAPPVPPSPVEPSLANGTAD
ncbi:MAG: hypothetical protein ABSD74_09515 [Rhizomicrobium sp.]|jgi:hypothetical protein